MASLAKHLRLHQTAEKIDQWLSDRQAEREREIQRALADGPVPLPHTWARPREQRWVAPSNGDIATRFVRAAYPHLPGTRDMGDGGGPADLATALRAHQAAAEAAADEAPALAPQQPWHDRPIDADGATTNYLLGLRSDAWHVHAPGAGGDAGRSGGEATTGLASAALVPLPDVPDSLAATTLPIASVGVHLASTGRRLTVAPVHGEAVEGAPSRSLKAAARAAVRQLAEAPGTLVAITRSEAGFSLVRIALPPSIDELAEHLSGERPAANAPATVGTAAGGELELRWRASSDALVAIAGTDGLLHVA